NAWAPEAYWEPLIDAYIVIFASRFWPETDPDRTGPQPPNKLMYVITNDFVNFSEARLYFYPGYPVIDATFIAIPEQGPNVWYRWIKSEVDYTIYQQRSENGILGDWVNVGGASDDVRVTFASQYSNNEGPLIFRDNLDAGKFHLWIDENDLQTYIPATANTLDDMGAWVPDDMSGFPKDVKHGKVLAVNQQQYDAILAKYKVVGS
ncbi:glycoside hydrolase family 43 protein, partial [Aureobasidium melanogenum]